MKNISLSRIYDSAFRALILFLPFYTFFAVFFREKLDIPGISFVKELLLFTLFFVVIVAHVTGKKRISWTRYDVAIGIYILIMVLVSLFTTGISGITYGWRYDFSFLLAFFTIFHGASFLEKPVSYYLRLFLVSSGIMLVISVALRWPLSEDLLRYVWYCGNPSNWQACDGVPPIFHGIDGANVRRFQWILDGPNTMGAFLLIYIGVFLYYFRNKKDWYFVLGAVTLFFFLLVFYTYSRSALLGLIAWVWFVILFSLWYIYRNYRKQLIILSLVFVLTLWALLVPLSGILKAIIERWWSTDGHAERMRIGIERFLDHPFWAWLGSAGPAYRYIIPYNQATPEGKENLDKKYIPESWYIQQLIEWGVFGFLAFLSIIVLLVLGLFRRHKIIIGMFIGILTMNMFLHTFESSLIALSVFLIIGLLLSPDTNTLHGKK